MPTEHPTPKSHAHIRHGWALFVLGLLAALWLLLQEPAATPLVAMAFRDPRKPDPGLWDDEPDPSTGKGEGAYDPFAEALNEEPAARFSNPLGGRPRFDATGRPARGDVRDDRRPPATDDPFGAGAADDPFGAGAADDPFGAGWEETPSGGNRRPFGARARAESSGARSFDLGGLGGFRPRTSRIAALLVIAGIAASFVPIGDAPHNLAGLLRPILRALGGNQAGPGLPDLFFLLAIGLTVFDSLARAINVIGGTQAAASIRRAIRRGADEMRFDDGDGLGGAIGAAGGWRGILFARRARGQKPTSPEPKQGERP